MTPEQLFGGLLGLGLKWRELPGRPLRAVRPPLPTKAVAVSPPAAHHPWRRASPLRGGDRRRRELEFGSLLPPLAPPPRTDGAITRSTEREKGTFSRELKRGHF